MGTRRIVLIAGVALALGGLALLKSGLAAPEESVFRSEIWRPHQSLSEGYNLALPFEGPIPGEKVSLEEARSRMPFPIPLPGYLPGSTRLMEVYASRTDTPLEFRQAALVYENGIHIILYYEPGTLSWTSWPEEHADIFKAVEVTGHAGVGSEPGPERICVSYAPSTEFECRDGSGSRPGMVQWQAEGLVTAVYSYDYSLAELLRVAESMDAG